jgi:hypothetical protein
MMSMVKLAPQKSARAIYALRAALRLIRKPMEKSYLDSNGKLASKPMRHGYWGPCFDDAAIESALNT